MKYSYFPQKQKSRSEFPALNLGQCHERRPRKQKAAQIAETRMLTWGASVRKCQRTSLPVGSCCVASQFVAVIDRGAVDTAYF